MDSNYMHIDTIYDNIFSDNKSNISEEEMIIIAEEVGNILEKIKLIFY